MSNHIYIHIPFCDKLCSYCDFVKLINSNRFIDDYLLRLEDEMSSYEFYDIKTLYIGGGTPSVLSAEQLLKLKDIISRVSFKDDYEFSVECNIESITEEKLVILRGMGVNRLSIGIQSFNNRLLEIMNRSHTKQQVYDTIDLVKRVGFSNINVDLMYAITSQTFDELKEDVQLFIDLDVNHISAYSLILEDKTVFSHLGIKAIDEDIEATFYEYVSNELVQHGYEHYEISNYAKKGFKSSHNQAYWNFSTYYGFGLGASAFDGNTRYLNTHSINQYLAKKKPEATHLSLEDKMSEYCFLHLRMNTGINLTDFYNYFNCHIDKIYDYQKYLDCGWLIQSDTNLYIPRDAFCFANEVFICFV